MASKIIIFYNQGQGGWTETYYSNYSVAQIDPYSTPWRAFLTARVSLLGGLGQIYGMRVSTLGAAREAYFWPFFNQWPNINTTNIFTAQLPEVVAVDAQVSIFDSTTKKRNLWLRGLPASLVTRDQIGNFVYNATLNSLINRLFTAMTNSGVNFQIQWEVAPPAAGLFYMQVVSVAQSATNPNWSTLTLNIAPNFTIANQPQARFLGVPHDNLPGFPRIALVTAQTTVAPFTISIPYRFRGVGPVTPPKMTLTQLAYSYTAFQFQQFERFSTHKTGRPFGTLRGRTRALVKAQ